MFYPVQNLVWEQSLPLFSLLSSIAQYLVETKPFFRLNKSAEKKGRMTDNVDEAFASRLSRLNQELDDEAKSTEAAVTSVSMLAGADPELLVGRGANP